jgi:Protein kinase domain
MTHLVALPQGTDLVGDYRIERVLGAGGFGITYLATETQLARPVTIKEYFPVDFAARDPTEDVCPRSRGSRDDYAWGLQRFLDEAKTLAKFRHPNIVGVHRYFEAKQTAYIVQHYEEGASLKGWLDKLGRAPRQDELDRIVAPLLDALEVIHAADFLHRDIAPDNIIIRSDGTPVLIDFGSARSDIARHSKVVSALVKPGYSPYEQYATSGRQQGPWTDIYALGATLYHAISGRRPLEAPSRMLADELEPARHVARASYRAEFLRAIDRALALDVTERPRSIADWRAELAPPANAARGATRGATAKAKAGAPMPPAVGPGASREPSAPPAPRRSLLEEFREGWRSASVATTKPPQRAPAAPPAADAAAAKPRGAPRREPAPPRVKEAPAAKPAVLNPAPASTPASPPAPDAAPHAQPTRRRRRGGGWRGLAIKLLIGVLIAAAAVAVQNRVSDAPRSSSSPVPPVPSPSMER